MRLSAKSFFWILAGVAFSRLFLMMVLPLVDTSEPRYAEIARLMASSNDWITPWFEPGIPFWGKPPLSFWAQALSIKLFGLSEFAVRLPSLLAMTVVAALVYGAGSVLYGKNVARWAAVILATMLLPLASAGAVLTDPFFALGITLSMSAFLVVRYRATVFWRYAFFVGLAIGLLAKGPLTIVLVAGSCLMWLAGQRDWQLHLKGLPWARGILLAALITLPWYIAAEIKTPGFIQYFIIGEHFLRFVDAGWAGDLYGTAHERPLGAIWMDWLFASLPWSLIVLSAIGGSLVKSSGRGVLVQSLRESTSSYLLIWAFIAPLFFTLSRNILWTYVLPSLPPMALMLGVLADRLKFAESSRVWIGAVRASLALVPVIALILGMLSLNSPSRFKTEKHLIAQAERYMTAHEKLYYVNGRPFSARYYSQGTAEVLSENQIAQVLPTSQNRVFLAIHKGQLPTVLRAWPGTIKALFSNRRYTLYEVRGN